MGCRFQNQAFGNLPLIDGKKVAKSVSRINGQTHRFLGKDSNLQFVHGKRWLTVFPLLTGKPTNSLQKTQMSYPFTKFYPLSRNFIRYHGRTWSESLAGNKSREKCRDGSRKFVNLFIREFADAAPVSWLLHYLCIWSHDLSGTLPRP